MVLVLIAGEDCHIVRLSRHRRVRQRWCCQPRRSPVRQLASDWATLDMPHDVCLARGEAAIRRLNFGAIEQTRYSRFGQDGDYTISVRCVSEESVVLFLAAGLSQRRAHEFQIELHRNYLK